MIDRCCRIDQDFLGVTAAQRTSAAIREIVHDRDAPAGPTTHVRRDRGRRPRPDYCDIVFLAHANSFTASTAWSDSAWQALAGGALAFLRKLPVSSGEHGSGLVSKKLN